MDMKRVEEIEGIISAEYEMGNKMPELEYEQVEYLIQVIRTLKHERDNYYKALSSYGRYIDTLENEYSQAIDVVRDHIHTDGRANKIYKTWCDRQDEIEALEQS